MKSLYRYILASAISLLLVGCQPQETETFPQLPSSPEREQCVQNCLTRQDHCVQRYNQIYEQCTMQKKHQGQLDYEAYLKRQSQQQAKPDKTLNDFVDTKSCKQQLDCTDGYNQCYSDCH